MRDKKNRKSCQRKIFLAEFFSFKKIVYCAGVGRVAGHSSASPTWFSLCFVAAGDSARCGLLSHVARVVCCCCCCCFSVCLSFLSTLPFFGKTRPACLPACPFKILRVPLNFPRRRQKEMIFLYLSFLFLFFPSLLRDKGYFLFRKAPP